MFGSWAKLLLMVWGYVRGQREGKGGSLTGPATVNIVLCSAILMIALWPTLAFSFLALSLGFFWNYFEKGCSWSCHFELWFTFLVFCVFSDFLICWQLLLFSSTNMV